MSHFITCTYNMCKDITGYQNLCKDDSLFDAKGLNESILNLVGQVRTKSMHTASGSMQCLKKKDIFHPVLLQMVGSR